MNETPPPDRATATDRPQVFGDFELQARIGEGGSAVVHRAVNRTFNGVVALKRWRGTLTDSQRRKFLQECNLQWQLSDHPNIVRLYWADAPADGPPWLATELYDESLADRLLREPAPSVAEAHAIADDLLSGLAAIHAEKMLHRDVKPANVLLKAARAALGDLGITMHLDGWTRDAAAGTDAFLAPELARGAPPSLRSDVYSAAVTIRRLFGSEPPPAVERVLTRATSYSPDDRPAGAEELRLALRRARGVPPAGTTEGPPEAAAGGPRLASTLRPVPRSPAEQPTVEAAVPTTMPPPTSTSIPDSTPAPHPDSTPHPDSVTPEAPASRSTAAPTPPPTAAPTPPPTASRASAGMDERTAERMVPLPPLPVASAPTGTPPVRRRRVALFGGVAAALAAVAGGGWFLAAHTGGTPTTTGTRGVTVTVTVPARTPQTATTATLPTAAATLPTGFGRVDAARGLSVAIPSGWTVKHVSGTSETRAVDPHDPQRFVQFGGYADGHVSQLRRVKGYEAAEDRPAYRRIRLADVSFGDSPDAVDWEYTYDTPAPVHAEGRYWRAGSSEYVVYVLAPQAEWPQTLAILRVMLAAASPR